MKVPDILKFDHLPQALKVQIIHILKDIIGTHKYHDNKYKVIHDFICREYGVFDLDKNAEYYFLKIYNFFLASKEIGKLLDIIEISFRYIDLIIRQDFIQYSNYNRILVTPDEAIFELNERFKEHGIGYSYDSGYIIKIDSTYIHTEITSPTISLLKNKKFTGANEEYLKALENYKNGKNKECLIEALKAFESTMKIICKELKWTFDQNDTAKKLISICFQHELVPKFTQNQFTSLQNLLESGVPTIRNKLGAHGQGQVIQRVDNAMTRYALNLTGSNIIFLIEQSGIK